jgi:hypothetical protein
MSSGKALAGCARQGSIKRSMMMNMNIASQLISSVQKNSVLFFFALETLLLVSKVRWPSGLDTLCRDQFYQMQHGLTVIKRYEVIVFIDTKRFNCVKSLVHIYKHKILVPLLC